MKKIFRKALKWYRRAAKQDHTESQRALEAILNDIARQHMVTPREVQILQMRFGIGTSQHTFKEISQVFDISGSSISQIASKALQKLYHFGILTGQITNVNKPSDLISKQIERLLKALNPDILVEIDSSPSGTQNTITDYEEAQKQSPEVKLYPILIRRIESLDFIYPLQECLESCKNRLSWEFGSNDRTGFAENTKSWQ